LTAFSDENFHALCDRLSAGDSHLKDIIGRFGYPPIWRRPNSFETLVHIILEQQVSLASALAALNQLRKRLGDVTPEGVLLLSDEELRDCYFSRQKTAYVRNLATAIVNKLIDLNAFELLPDAEIREQLLQLKGVGNWTIDIYLIFVLRRADVFPLGDLAAVNALKEIKGITRDDLLHTSEQWKPYRTIATMILWHYYLSKRIKK
jgi:DNA-3-methyladenine glycosylase II